MSRFELLTHSATFLKEFDEATREAIRPIRPHYLGMSSIGRCAREQWYRYHMKEGLAMPPPANLQRIFDLGHDIEERVMTYLRAMPNLNILSMQGGYEDFGGLFRGHSDLVYALPSGDKVVLDVKSMNARGFDRFLRSTLREYDWAYYAQLQCYAGYEGAAHVQLLAYNKDTSEVATLFEDFNERDFHMFRERAYMISSATEPPPCEKGNGRVKYCNCV